jgi:hypothetical protein
MIQASTAGSTSTTIRRLLRLGCSEEPSGHVGSADVIPNPTGTSFQRRGGRGLSSSMPTAAPGCASVLGQRCGFASLRTMSRPSSDPSGRGGEQPDRPFVFASTSESHFPGAVSFFRENPQRAISHGKKAPPRSSDGGRLTRSASCAMCGMLGDATPPPQYAHRAIIEPRFATPILQESLPASAWQRGSPPEDGPDRRMLHEPLDRSPRRGPSTQ